MRSSQVIASPPRSILEETLAAAVRDGATVTPDGQRLQRLTEGVSFRPAPTHVDARGSVVEMFDPRWLWHSEPFAFAYCFTIRPGVVKGWNLHKEHEDRYVLLQGEMELLLYDPRPDSATCGTLCRIVLSEHNRGIVNIPRNVWHADHNIGAKDAVAVNFPTAPYDHANPDKYRLPIDTPLIPHTFPPGTTGW
jgi:dTDP-4-dehydrorhamnose 3,5-epimerase